MTTARLWIGRRVRSLVQRPAFWAFGAAAAVGAVVAQRAAAQRGDDPFDRFLGPVPPTVAVVAAAGAGAVCLRVLERRNWYRVGARVDREEAAKLVGGAIVLAGAAIVVDVLVGFDEDMNVLWPQSVPYYATMAFLAEVALHVVPLAALAAAVERRPGPTSSEPRAALATIVAVATIEALLQVAPELAGADRRSLALFVAPHLLVIGVVELLAFRRAGFGALATFRLTYYLVWHVLWGALRLRLLF